MEQHPVPQNITGFQFKLVGDMTLRQFGFLAFGVTLAYLFYHSQLHFLLKWPLIILTSAGGFAFAFMPLEERPLDHWLVSFFKDVYCATQFFWKKKKIVPSFFLTLAGAGTPTPAAPFAPRGKSRLKLEAYLKTLPATKREIDEKEENFLNKINSYFGVISPAAAPFSLSEEFLKLPGIEEREKGAFHFDQRIISIPQEEETHYVPAIGSLRIRKLHPPGGVTLPVKGETRFELSEDLARKLAAMPFFAEEKTKIREEKEIPRPAPPSPLWERPTVVPPAVPYPVARPLEVLAETGDLEAQNQALKEELEKLKARQEVLQKKKPLKPTEEKSFSRQLLEIQKKLQEVLTEKERLEKDLVKLKREKEEVVSPVIPQEVIEKGSARVKIISPSVAEEFGFPQLSTIPNIVTGIVKGGQGEILPDIIVEIKDEEGNSLRALKTNKLGQFAAATSLPSGTYTLELEDPRKIYQFDIIGITLKGEVLPPLLILAKGNDEAVKREKQFLGGN